MSQFISFGGYLLNTKYVQHIRTCRGSFFSNRYIVRAQLVPNPRSYFGTIIDESYATEQEAQNRLSELSNVKSTGKDNQ